MRYNHYPTPIEKINLSINENNLFIKREDLISTSFGGNKARKAFLFFNELQKQNCNCVITYGSSSSNHCRVVANIAAAKGLKCIIISPTSSSSETFNSKMMKFFGAKIINCNVNKVKETIDDVMRKTMKQGYKPYFIEGGGHGNIGTKAYLEAYEEIKTFEIENNINFDFIFHTSGTGTTQAGLICGKLINHDSKEIIGISNARRNPYGSQVVLDSVNNYLEELGRPLVDLRKINFVDDYVCNGYGSYNKEIINVIKTLLIEEGIPMDLTYTGKGFWGMKEYIKRNQLINKNILFIHTGGTPLFYDDLEVLIDG